MFESFKITIVYCLTQDYPKRVIKLINYNNNIFLVGPMGSGKTTIGRILAEIIGCKFFDLDSEVEKKCGANIAWIFDVEGEAGFRKRESRILQEIVSGTGIVLATGGGAILDKKNREILKKSGYIVYLNAPIGRLLERTSHDHNRPLLCVKNPREAIEKLVSDREPLYQDVANLVVTTEKKKPRLVAEEIADEVRNIVV